MIFVASFTVIDTVCMGVGEVGLFPYVTYVYFVNRQGG